MPLFPNINTLLFKVPEGDEKIQISATEYTTLKALLSAVIKGSTNLTITPKDFGSIDLTYEPQPDDTLEEIIAYLLGRVGGSSSFVGCYDGMAIFLDRDISTQVLGMWISGDGSLKAKYADYSGDEDERIWTPQGLYQYLENKGNYITLTHPDNLYTNESNSIILKPGDVVFSTSSAPIIQLKKAYWESLKGGQYTASIMAVNANITSKSISCESGKIYFSEYFDIAPATEAQVVAVQMYKTGGIPVFVFNKCGYSERPM